MCDRCGQGLGQGVHAGAAAEPPGRRVEQGVGRAPRPRGAVTELAEHLLGEGIEKVTVESTSDYWRIWFYLLEAAGLDGAAGQRPRREERAGPPEDRQARRGVVGQAHREGPAAAEFVPPAPIRELRDYTRLRVDLTRERSRYWQRLEKLLEDALIKVSAVASTLDTLSVRDMLEALIAGERDPRRLAGLARGRMRPKQRRPGRGVDRPVRRSPRRTGPDAARPDRRVGPPDRHPHHPHRRAARRDRPAAAARRRAGRRAAARARAPTVPASSTGGRATRPRSPASARARADHPRRDRAGHEPVPHRRAPGVVGQTVPHAPSSPGPIQRSPARPARATRISKGRSARPPPRPPRPTPSSANATGASSNAAANSRPSSRSPAPSWSSSGTCSPTPPPASTTSAPTTTPPGINPEREGRNHIRPTRGPRLHRHPHPAA